MVRRDLARLPDAAIARLRRCDADPAGRLTDPETSPSVCEILLHISQFPSTGVQTDLACRLPDRCIDNVIGSPALKGADLSGHIEHVLHPWSNVECAHFAKSAAPSIQSTNL